MYTRPVHMIATIFLPILLSFIILTLFRSNSIMIMFILYITFDINFKLLANCLIVTEINKSIAVIATS